MRKNVIVFLVAAMMLGLLFFNACSKTTSTGNNNLNNVSCSTGALPVCPTGNNVIPIQIGPQTVCGQNGYVNEPCVTVTVCTPGLTGSGHCTTIGNVLLDTGSYGLRLYRSVLGN